MSKMIQVRNVPDELHRTLKVRAAERGLSLSDYVLSELEEVVQKPTLEEWVANVRARPRTADIPPGFVTDLIRQHRGPLP